MDVQNDSESVTSPEYLVGIRRVAIIGAGPTGVACAKYLLAERNFDTIDVFEQRDNVGGIWNLSGNDRSRAIPIPQTDSEYGALNDDKSLEFESPLYDYLETNIPKPLMAYSDLPFSPDLPLFPKHAYVLRYLEHYAQPVRHLIRFRHQVIDLRPQNGEDPTIAADTKWNILVKDLTSNLETSAEYDAVVVANGHYTVPHVPEIRGLREWNNRYPGIVIHSKAYRRPEHFTNKKVLVVGNSASGLDIAGQLAPYAQHPVFLASRSASQVAPSGDGPSWRREVPEIEEFVVDTGDRCLRTSDGQVLEEFDTIIFATGYFYSFPFLRKPISKYGNSVSSSQSASTSSIFSESTDPNGAALKHRPTSNSDSLDHLTTSGLRTHDVYRHFLHIDHPTLAIPVLNLKVIPFPLAQNQAAVIARLWSGRMPLPSKTTMRQWEADEEKRLLKANRLRPGPNTATGDTIKSEQLHDRSHDQKYEGGFHTLVYPEDVNQINMLYEWAASAQKREGLENDGIGKLGTRRNEEQVWMRGQFADIKAAYAKHGKGRFAITSLDMLGEEWKDGYQKWNARTSEGERRDLFRRAAVQGW